MKAYVLSAEASWEHEDRLELYACGECEARFFSNITAPDYATSGYGESAVKFYIEVGAGLDSLVRHLFSVRLQRGQRYLEVGCGFGFAVDFGYHALGLDAVGIDPSPFAVAGAEALGLGIRHEYLTDQTDLGADPFALVVASEVIEHLTDATAFLQLIGDRLAPDGVLILTTPDGRYTVPETPASALLPLLSPGLHCVLHSEASLKLVLQRAGFAHIQIVSRDRTLVAAAARSEVQVNLLAAVDRSVYRSYLERRLHSVHADSWLWHGLGYRLLKELTNTAEYSPALKVFKSLCGSIRRSYGFDISDMDPTWLEGAGRTSFVEFAHQYPLNLCGVCYFRGIIALNYYRDRVYAARCFSLAEKFGTLLREKLIAIGADDTETADLVAHSRHLWMRAIAHGDPMAAADAALRLLTDASEYTPTEELRSRGAVASVFSHLVNLGALAAAERLAPAVRAHLSTSAFRGSLSWSSRHEVLRSLGMLSLNGHREGLVASKFFAAAERVSRGWCEAEPGSKAAVEALWKTRYDRLLSCIVAGDVRRAMRAARQFSGEDSRTGRVPDKVARDAARLIARLPRKHS